MSALRFSYRRLLLLASLCLLPAAVSAGGITLNTTRVIYPQDAKQLTVSVRNTADKSTFLVQSWVENPDGHKSRDFVITPPLYTSAPNDENLLRLIFSGHSLPVDRESLYYLNVKGVPSVDKEAMANQNALVLAAITRIKMFVRPVGLTPSADDAPQQLRFSRAEEKLKITNPTPYYLTLTDMKVGKNALQPIMVSPLSDAYLDVAVQGDRISYSTINDYGATTPPREVSIYSSHLR